jgi:hypothetical protein
MYERTRYLRKHKREVPRLIRAADLGGKKRQLRKSKKVLTTTTTTTKNLWG